MQVTIPHHVLKIYDEDGNLQSAQLTGFLEDENDIDSIDGAECDPHVNKTLDNGTNDNGQEDEEEERLVDVQQVGKNDKMRMAIKNNLKSREGQENYETALTVVQSKVLAKHSTLKRQFQEWEKGFFAEGDCNEPTADDNRAYELYKTLRLCKQFLQHWKITVHL